MLVVTLGTQASASTWVFNVVRAIFATHRPAAVSYMVEEGASALNCLGSGARDVVYKAHTFDRALHNLMLLANAKVIVTSRDPRDSVVSQTERFQQDFKQAAVSLTRSLVAIASLDPRIETLHLRFEEAFFDDPQSIVKISEFIGIRLYADEAKKIFDGLSRSRVQSQIDAWATSEQARDPGEWDRVTQWHRGHIGDGIVGKWRNRLPANLQSAAQSALMPFDTDIDWCSQEIIWPAELFYTTANDIIERDVELTVDGTAHVVLYGPYMHLPVGIWAMQPLVEVILGAPLTIKLDVFTLAEGRDILQLKTVTLSEKDDGQCMFEVDVIDYTHPIEFRIASMSDGRSGRIRFSGVRLRYLGESQGRLPALAHSVLT